MSASKHFASTRRNHTPAKDELENRLSKPRSQLIAAKAKIRQQPSEVLSWRDQSDPHTVAVTRKGAIQCMLSASSSWLMAVVASVKRSRRETRRVRRAASSGQPAAALLASASAVHASVKRGDPECRARVPGRHKRSQRVSMTAVQRVCSWERVALAPGLRGEVDGADESRAIGAEKVATST